MLYAGAGVALGAATGRAGGRVRVTAHPHYAHWVEFAGLVADGLHFLRNDHQRDYTTIVSAGARDRGNKSKSRRKNGLKRLDALDEMAGAVT